MLKAKGYHERYADRVRFAHAKVDGHRVLVRRDESGVGVVTTRKPVDITAAVHWHQGVQQALSALQPCESIEGELWIPGKPASDVKTAINEQWDTLRFDAFAVSVLEPEAPLTKVQTWCLDREVPFLQYFVVPLEFSLETMQPHHDYEVRPYIEGWVLKGGNLSDWYKFKPTRTADLVVTGFVEGNGKYDGFVGALLCSVVQADGSYREVASVSGMDEETRFAISEQTDLHRVVEVAYQYVGSGGRLRHPRFITWRDDKHIHECGEDQLC